MWLTLTVVFRRESHSVISAIVVILRLVKLLLVMHTEFSLL